MSPPVFRIPNPRHPSHAPKLNSSASNLGQPFPFPPKHIPSTVTTTTQTLSRQTMDPSHHSLSHASYSLSPQPPSISPLIPSPPQASRSLLHYPSPNHF
ncbi:hypothetical protein Pcinc_027240 [Petrolisthes cinctipes]|uniref:Uncharacterized protein n=1 Tax=Petrolisthes cinctipes TaxID=88211 RepID=A0AAE1F5D3_PETCI|nr:hypothetical protein Pcinc_027240 [Petrolisthes cinctipes]